MGGVSRVGTVFAGGRGGGDFARGTGKVAELRDEAPRQVGGLGVRKGLGLWKQGTSHAKAAKDARGIPNVRMLF